MRNEKDIKFIFSDEFDVESYNRILDLIKQCKAMGLSLDEIKNIIENYTSPESVLHIIRKQKEIVDEKIKELNNIKDKVK